MSKIIKHQFSFSHTPETVWGYLTQSELLEQWLMKNDFKPVVGATFNFWTNPIPGLNFDGIVYGKVLEVEPFERLSYTWTGGSGDGEITLDTVVVWQLQATQKGTDLILEHRGFGQKEHVDFFPGMTSGWEKLIPKIAKLLEE